MEGVIDVLAGLPAAVLRHDGDFVETEPISMVPKSTVKVEGKAAEHLLKLMEELEELEDVQKVWANFDIDVADMAASA